MFRRRASRRMARGFQPPAVPPLLRRAHRMMQAGDYEDAAASFYELAQKAEERFPERAPVLYLEAGRAAILGGDAKKGIAHLRRGLTILASQGRHHRMRKAGERILLELRERGLNAEADEIAVLLRNNLPGESDAPVSQEHPILPTHCPACGAAVKPDEVDWLDDVTAECDYCGSPVRSESG
ncbi:MAG: hypothetical protein HND47_15885 [Chloroflexi bacterium]|nr:hypothetical protein [Chloroflexota bacterium]